MDPITHGLIGATATQSAAPQKDLLPAALAGFVAALIPDADIFISDPVDPLLNVELHRQFSHSLIFIPIGAFIASLLLWWFMRKRFSWAALYGYSLLGYATAGVTDTLTSYGTKLLWPFIDERYSWNIISVFDPLFTAGLLAMVLLALYKQKKLFMWMGWCWVFIYLLFGLSQQEQAKKEAHNLALERGHSIDRMVIKPTIANQLLWSIRYQQNDTLYAAGVQLTPFAEPVIYEGEVAPLLDWRQQYRRFEGTTLYGDIRRFDRLSDGYLIRHPERKQIIGDGRYAMLPTSLSPLWGVRTDTSQPDNHLPFLNFRDASEEVRSAFLKMLRGTK